MKNIDNKIKQADACWLKLSSKYKSVLSEILKHFLFDLEYEFYIEHQDSDGIVLGDSDARVYHLTNLINYIKENKNITSYDELKQFRI